MSENPKIQEALSKTGSVYISITGLRIKGPLAFFGFWRHAIPSKFQADKAPGLLFIDLKTVNRFHHTFTAWENKQAMQTYLRRGAHLRAMRVFREIATGKVIGYEAQSLPSWEEALRIWAEQGKTV
jgi:hypothetical protein